MENNYPIGCSEDPSMPSEENTSTEKQNENIHDFDIASLHGIGTRVFSNDTDGFYECFPNRRKKPLTTKEFINIKLECAKNNIRTKLICPSDLNGISMQLKYVGRDNYWRINPDTIEFLYRYGFLDENTYGNYREVVPADKYIYYKFATIEELKSKLLDEVSHQLSEHTGDIDNSSSLSILQKAIENVLDKYY